jgi:hypothetical protein
MNRLHQFPRGAPQVRTGFAKSERLSIFSIIIVEYKNAPGALSTENSIKSIGLID